MASTDNSTAPYGASATPGRKNAAAGPGMLLWIFYSALLVLLMDQAGQHGTVPFGQDRPLMDLGLAAAVAVACQRGVMWWLPVAIGGLLSGALLEKGWLDAPLWAAGLLVGGAVSRWMLRVCQFDSRMRSVTDVLGLALFAAPAASCFSAMVVAALPVLIQHGDIRGAAADFLEGWLSGWVGILMFTPFIFSIGVEYFQRWNPARTWEWVLINLLLVGSLLVMMDYLNPSDTHRYPLAYLALPSLFWTAWRYGPPGAALANLFIGAVTSLCAWSGIGPFSGENGGMMILMLAWAFLGFHGLVALLLAALTDERRVELLQQRQRARFLRQVIDQLPCGILIKDVTDKPILVNRRWFQLFGQTSGTEEDQLAHQQSIEPFWRGRELQLLQNLGEILREEGDSTDSDGKAVELLLTKQAAFFDQYGERLLTVVADDVSSGRSSLADLRRVVERMHEALAAADVGMWEWHIPSGMIRFDAQFSKLTGIPEHDEGISVQVWQQGILEADRPQFQDAMLRHLHQQEELFATRFRFLRNGKWQWLVVRGRIVEQDVRKLGVRMIGTLQEARATVLPLPDPNALKKG